MTNIITTSARIFKFKTIRQIQAMSRHSLRLDGASLRRVRPGAEKGAALQWSSRLHDDGIDPEDFVSMRDVDPTDRFQEIGGLPERPIWGA